MKPIRLAALWMAFLTAPVFAAGTSAGDYFHDAAHKYVAGRHQEASVETEEGLREHPGDAHLKALADLLKQMKDQQRQDQNQSGGGQDPDKQDQKNQQNKQDPKKGKDGQQNPDPKDGDKQDSQKSPSDSSGQDKQKKPPEAQGREQGDSSGQAGKAPRKPGQMSKEEAERLLNSFQNEEKKEQRERQQPRRNRPDVEEDW